MSESKEERWERRRKLVEAKRALLKSRPSRRGYRRKRL